MNPVTFGQTADWDDLRYFLAVAQTGSLLGASKLLNVNHSTVFRRIQSLEDKLKQPLFLRSKEGYLLNDSGQVVFKHTQNMAEQLDVMNLKLSGLDNRLKGKISITAPSGIIKSQIIPAAAQFKLNHPDVMFEFVSSNEKMDLRRGEADIAIRATLSPPDYLIGHKLKQFPWAIYASKAFIEKHSMPQSLEACFTYDWIGPNKGMDIPSRNAFDQKIPDKCFVYRSNDLAIFRTMAQQSLGLCLLPKFTDLNNESLIELDHITPDATDSQLWVLVHPDLKGSARVMGFYRFLIEYFDIN
ncbi:MAG: LysR family transcriptional regulator [Saccharospirillaceae bacterium]|nr:LysR family transcriptional regulator [Pseudomonadales bacterium]NRB81335.1 LysR family transcriptional regulator [Saccharospirillaceae bacterium]